MKIGAATGTARFAQAGTVAQDGEYAISFQDPGNVLDVLRCEAVMRVFTKGSVVRVQDFPSNRNPEVLNPEP